MSKSLLLQSLVFALVVTATSTLSLALPVQVAHVDTPQCDMLSIPNEGVHEIGDAGVFPADEALSALDIGIAAPGPCSALDDPSISNPVVDIRNLSGRPWLEVWYVASPETTITNFDGEADDIAFGPLQEAFRIDYMVSDPGGIHHPLISESLTPDGIWEPGESWQFILQDYSNSLSLPPDAINSLGVGSASMVDPVGFITSSGSIIGITIPEPGTLALATLALIAIVRRSSKR